ncbi:hypothetical protein [Wolbachia endosymbiont of Dirofilaria (Dirofilaria) immitis]|uniref:hypothetical protein n=1 Tax=Wolbachia endosymbiont of Dirofilaria (Dirofilaria) immitis TaxID=1812115 RepID=UPI00158DFC88|nr:hypothetical protein [Wolbachia endosymbiont of Dirofilaria (Dirofilaria) immitis]QKX02451.1 hypothetical protein GOY12_02700 [Wolbachia endosymbiont of Dirofilaria (Dirofilaria) immitis]
MNELITWVQKEEVILIKTKSVGGVSFLNLYSDVYVADLGFELSKLCKVSTILAL